MQQLLRQLFFKIAKSQLQMDGQVVLDLLTSTIFLSKNPFSEKLLTEAPWLR